MTKCTKVADAYQLSIPFEEYDATILVLPEDGLEVEECSTPEVLLTMVKVA